MTAASVQPVSAETALESLIAALGKARLFNRNAEVAPAVVLWTDEERHWERLVELRLRARLPLLTLGEFDLNTRTGPAIWLRCAIAGVLPELEPLTDVPIIYLPGVSRAMLRAVEDCPKPLQPLAELQYRGVFFSHPNGKDWTPAGFLQGGLNIQVNDAKATREALGRALVVLADEPLPMLRAQAPLKAGFLNTLLTPDPERRLLEWLSDPKGERERMDLTDAGAWEAFRGLCSAQYGFDPVKDGELTAAVEFAGRSNQWAVLWDRFADAPHKYPGIEGLLRRAQPAVVSLFDEVYPQAAEAGEQALRAALLNLKDSSPVQARAALLGLEAQHGARRRSVWAKLGRAPLAMALEHLTLLAGATEQALGAGSSLALAERYAAEAWRTDWAAVQALASVPAAADLMAVKVAVRAVYQPWLEDGARAFQQAVKDSGYVRSPALKVSPGTCLVFFDGLRFDAGAELEARLARRGARTQLDWRLTALPSVTDTAKPAVSPAASRLTGGAELKASYKGSKVTAEVLRRAMSEEGYTILKDGAASHPSEARGWVECGDLDGIGHDQGVKLAGRIAVELDDLEHQVLELLESGWHEVKVITDHGWLLVPGGMPAVKLPEHLCEVRKGRCARLKPNAATDQQTVPWAFSDDVRIAVAPGIACYTEGREYEHGGLSVQECVVPVLTVSLNQPAALGLVVKAQWTGLRCQIEIEGAVTDATVDIRAKASDPTTSFVVAKTLGSKRTVTLFAEDDRDEGKAALVVVLDGDGNLLAQITTVIGGTGSES